MFLESILDKYNLRGYLSHYYLPTYEEMASITYMKPAISQSEVEIKEDDDVNHYESESSDDSTIIGYDTFFTQVREEGEHDHISHIVKFYNYCNCMRILRMGTYTIWRDPDCTTCHCELNVGFDCGYYEGPPATSQSEIIRRMPQNRNNNWFERLCLWVVNNPREYMRRMFIVCVCNYIIGFIINVLYQLYKLEEVRKQEDSNLM
jgi:hypothetical protein